MLVLWLGRNLFAYFVSAKNEVNENPGPAAALAPAYDDSNVIHKHSGYTG